MIFSDAYCVDPDPFYTPRISISPFKLEDAGFLDSPKTVQIGDMPTLSALGSELEFTTSGKRALEIYLLSLSPSKSDNVGIVTTSGNSYVSKCVTETIERYCSWVVNDTTNCSIILVIHEFGYLVSPERMAQLRALGLPIINDFAYSFLGLYASGRKDFHGERNFTSLPKAFRMNFGGVMSSVGTTTVSPDNTSIKVTNDLVSELHDSSLQESILARERNTGWLLQNLQILGVKPYWGENFEGVPSVAMFSFLGSLDYPGLKDFLNRQGVESSVFYGQSAFFLPTHQSLSKAELAYILAMTKFGLKNFSR